MDPTYTAYGLVLPERAFERSLSGIFIEYLAALTALIRSMMMTTVHINHDTGRHYFPIHSSHRFIPLDTILADEPHGLCTSSGYRPSVDSPLQFTRRYLRNPSMNLNMVVDPEMPHSPPWLL
jgi:hypothetical protein